MKEESQRITTDIFTMLHQHFECTNMLVALLHQDDGGKTLLYTLVKKAVLNTKDQTARMSRPLHNYPFITGPDESFLMDSIKRMNAASHIIWESAIIDFEHTPGSGTLDIAIKLS